MSPAIRAFGSRGGGEVQYQRILPSDMEFVRDYFADKAPDECIFDKTELENKIDLHHLRACQAKRAYLYYLKGIQDPVFRDNLIKELEARWHFNKLASGCHGLPLHSGGLIPGEHLYMFFLEHAFTARSLEL